MGFRNTVRCHSLEWDCTWPPITASFLIRFGYRFFAQRPTPRLTLARPPEVGAVEQDRVWALPACATRLPTVVSRLPTVARRLPTVARKLPTVVSRLPALVRRFPAAVCRLPRSVWRPPEPVSRLPSCARLSPKEVSGLPNQLTRSPNRGKFAQPVMFTSKISPM